VAITSPYEQAARARKVAALLVHVPVGNGNEASRLASFTPQMRAVFARCAGVRLPSETTWTALCEAVRLRARKAAA
jgi:hypothetical protein